MIQRRDLISAGVALALIVTACGDSTSPTHDQRAPGADLFPGTDGPHTTTDGPLTPPDGGRPDQLRPDLPPKPLTATVPLSFSHKEQPFSGFAYDTGWLPGGSPVQIRITATITSVSEATLPGKATLTRNGALALRYAGNAGAGAFSMDIGFQFSAKLRIDTAIVKWEGTLPFVPQFDLRFVDSKTFTPFVLQTAPVRPIHLEHTVVKNQLFYVPIPGLSISLPLGTLGGVVLVKAGGTVKSDLSGRELSTTLSGGPTLKHTIEGQTVTSPDRGKNSEQASASYVADVVYSGAITLYPTITITTPIPGVKWEVAEFPITMDLSTFGKLDWVWTFAAQSLAFNMQ
jgi:hypothetical protein